jgi:Protein of unknown function (DUF1353)
MQKIFCILLITMGVTTCFAEEISTGFFEGTLELKPLGCEIDRNCVLTYKLRYTDPNNMVWQADANNVTDGASIPTWAQPFIGAPYDPQFIKPAAIHDHYCEKIHRVRGWRETHKMFYQALTNQGVKETKAKIMYLAVYIGGPKWRTVLEGRNCGDNCINATKTKIIHERSTMNDNQKRKDSFQEIQKMIEQKGGTLSLVEIEALVKNKITDDDFFNNPDLVDETLQQKKM